jgi:hypothetical protein
MGDHKGSPVALYRKNRMYSQLFSSLFPRYFFLTFKPFTHLYFVQVPGISPLFYATLYTCTLTTKYRGLSLLVTKFLITLSLLSASTLKINRLQQQKNIAAAPQLRRITIAAAAEKNDCSSSSSTNGFGSLISDQRVFNSEEGKQ